MATRWSSKDGHLKTGKGRFLSCYNPSEFVLNRGEDEMDMDTQSSVDHSILAIFEDTSVLSEDKAKAEEESDKLLTALTEMLESVEDDDEDTLSPFSSLPDTTLLTAQKKTDNTVETSSFGTSGTHPHVFKQQNGALCRPTHNKVEGEVEVFTSVSLVNLVKIMHPYCLKLRVEEEQGTSTKNNVLFSKEEVWKYERPTEDNDEEINVVSDDEGPVQEVHLRKELENNGKHLKSALLNGSPTKAHLSRERKRVSFGSVQVTSFDELLEIQKSDITSSPAHLCTKALKKTTDLALQAQTSSENSHMSVGQPGKPEAKRKPLSLQQYRQLRQKRQPLVEKQGNYTTKWPSVSEPPTELTPLFCLQGEKKTHYEPMATQDSTDGTDFIHGSPGSKISIVQPPGFKTSSDPPQKVKRQRPNCKIISLAAQTLNVPVCKKSPTKKQTVHCSDPPNPVLVPLPVIQPSKHMNEPAMKHNKNTIPPQSLQFSEAVSITIPKTALKCNSQSPSSAEENKPSPNTLDSSSQCSATNLSSPKSMPPTPVTTSVTSEDFFRMSPPSLQSLNLISTPSGIEATDLTSLLEQFEETQAKEEGRCERALQDKTEHFSKLDTAAQNSIQQRNQVLLPDPALLTPQTEALLSTSDSTPTLKPFNSRPNIKIPEPLGTEVILSTQEQPARRRAPLLKSIQIIEPRPLLPKRTHTSEPAAVYTPPHIYSSIASDHDYCIPVTGETDGNKTSKLNGTLQSSDEKHGHLSAPDECTKQSSDTNNSAVTFENYVKYTSQDKRTTLLYTAKGQNSCSSDSCIPPTPPPSPPCRGRDRRRNRRRSPRSDSSCSSCSSSSYSSSSRSRSPKRQKRYHQHSESSSCSSSPSRSVSHSPPRQHKASYSKTGFSRSRSRSCPRSRSRSPSPPQRICRRWRDACRSRELRKLRREQEIRMQKLRAIDERRVVYVGRIRRSMTHDELRERFSQFGEVECVSLHFRDDGDHYGFVTFYNMEDAFGAIDNGGKLRRPDELPFDICFGGRRQFCNSNYADLDANRDADSSPVQNKFVDVDFDLLLKQAQKELKS